MNNNKNNKKIITTKSCGHMGKKIQDNNIVLKDGRNEKWYELADEEIKVWLDNNLDVPDNVILLPPTVSYVIQAKENQNQVKDIGDVLKLQSSEYSQ